MDEDGGIWIFSGKGMGIVGIVCVAIGVLVIGGMRAADKESTQRAVEREVVSIEQQVLKDALSQFQVVISGNDKTAICVHAGLVSAALVQAKEQALYLDWAPTEAYHCARAGVPRSGMMEGAGNPCNALRGQGSAVEAVVRKWGVCMNAAECTGSNFEALSGLCAGSSEIRCCVPARPLNKARKSQ